MSLSRSVIVEVAVLVERSDVAGVQPAVLVDRLAGGLRVVEVAEHDELAAQQQLTLAALRVALRAAMRASIPGIARPQVLATVSAESPSRHIVATTASVIPNAVTTLSIASPSGAAARIRSMSTTGTTAAPVTASRSEERS